MRSLRLSSVTNGVLAVLLVCTVVDAETLVVHTEDGRELEVSYQKRTLRKTGVVLDSGDLLGFDSISRISTDHFDAYERAVKITSRKRAEHVTIEFTGKENVHLLRLRKLEKKRSGAGVARGAGGFMMLLGALSGDRDVYAAGLTTYGIGTIVKDIHTDRMIDAQNQAIEDVAKGQASRSGSKEDVDIEAQYRRDWGNEVVDGLLALIDGNHERALALAAAGETSPDANHRVAAAWLKAIIAADRGDEVAAEAEYERLVVLDPELGSVNEGHEWMKLLLDDLNELRAG